MLVAVVGEGGHELRLAGCREGAAQRQVGRAPHASLCSPPDPAHGSCSKSSPCLLGPHRPPTQHRPRPRTGAPSQAPARGRGRLTQGLLLEVGALQAVAGRRPGEKALPFVGPGPGRGPSPSHPPHTADSWVADRDRGPRNPQETQKGLHDLGGQRPGPHTSVWEGPSRSRHPCPPAGRVSTFSWDRT